MELLSIKGPTEREKFRKKLKSHFFLKSTLIGVVLGAEHDGDVIFALFIKKKQGNNNFIYLKGEGKSLGGNLSKKKFFVNFLKNMFLGVKFGEKPEFEVKKYFDPPRTPFF